MNDREKFQENLNYYLNKYGKMQKDLADYVGAKTTTVSGWTRGVSYPRSDAMEKIANFFGVPTSRLVGLRADEDCPALADVQQIVDIVSRLTPEQKKQAYSMLRVMFPEV